MVGELDAPYRLKDALDRLEAGFDAIIIDTPPTLGSDHRQRPGRREPRPGARSSPRTSPSRAPTTSSRPSTRSRRDPTPSSSCSACWSPCSTAARSCPRQVLQGDPARSSVRSSSRRVITKSVRLEEAPAHQLSIFDHAPAFERRLRVLPTVRGGSPTCRIRVSKASDCPPKKRMRHDRHFVDELAQRMGEGYRSSMVRVTAITSNHDQPRTNTRRSVPISWQHREARDPRAPAGAPPERRPTSWSPANVGSTPPCRSASPRCPASS